MAVRAKSLNLFLMDGEPSGRIKCTMANWTGIAYKIPRTALARSKDLEMLKQSGVYFLFGTDKEDNPVIYIGQAGIRKNGQGLLYRVQEAHTSIDYWTEVVMFTVTNNAFGPTEISYLENRFCNLAMEAKRYFVKNGNDPNPGNLTEEKESELEEFIDNAKIVMGVLGHKAFEPLVTAISDEQILYVTRNNSKASGKRVSDGFVVLKGSLISEHITKSCPEHVLRLRHKHGDKILNNLLVEDILFSSPSGAAAFVCGGSANGNLEWKNAMGTTLKELDAEIEKGMSSWEAGRFDLAENVVERHSQEYKI